MSLQCVTAMSFSKRKRRYETFQNDCESRMSALYPSSTPLPLFFFLSGGAQAVFVVIT